MNITKDFEKRLKEVKILELLAYARALESLLTEIRWSHGECIYCGAFEGGGDPHSCHLARLLEYGAE